MPRSHARASVVRSSGCHCTARIHQRRIFTFDPFDHAVRRDRGHAQAAAEAVNRLMVVRVHSHRSGPGRRGEARAGRDAHVVRADIPVTRRIVVHLRRPLARQILIQRPAERDVQNLRPAANRKQRELARAGGFDQREFGRVARRIDFAEFRMRRGAVARGIDVLTAGDQQPAG